MTPKKYVKKMREGGRFNEFLRKYMLLAEYSSMKRKSDPEEAAVFVGKITIEQDFSTISIKCALYLCTKIYLFYIGPKMHLFRLYIYFW